MSTDSRSAILARLRGSCAGASADELERARDALGVAPAARLLDEDPQVAFMARALKNQGTLELAGDRSSAVRAVGRYVYEHFRSHRLVAGNDPHLAAMPWRDGGVLPRFGALEPGEPVALSYGRLGVAETGAVITLTGKGNPGANNLLPERHIVLLEASSIVADLEAMWATLRRIEAREGRPRGINCLAGPSSTADVEATLVYGAHGPRAWHVILMGECEEAQLTRAREIAGVG